MLGSRVRGDDDAEAVRPGTRPGHEIPGSRAPVGAAPRVLLIDDRIPADDAFVHRLTRRGVAVTCAETGTRGLELSVAGPWAAVLLDLHLPDLPGLAVLSRLRAARVDVPVIVITGWDGDGDLPAASARAPTRLAKRRRLTSHVGLRRGHRPMVPAVSWASSRHGAWDGEPRHGRGVHE